MEYSQGSVQNVLFATEFKLLGTVASFVNHMKRYLKKP